MPAKSLRIPSARRYDEDFLAWTKKTAGLLRAGRFRELDLENVIEEVETLGRSEWRELDNRLVGLLKHLLKWKYQAARRCTSWESTLVTQRRKLRRLLRRSPSLKSGLPAQTFPDRCPFTPEQILDPDFLPD